MLCEQAVSSLALPELGTAQPQLFCWCFLSSLKRPVIFILYSMFSSYLYNILRIMDHGPWRMCQLRMCRIYQLRIRWTFQLRMFHMYQMCQLWHLVLICVCKLVFLKGTNLLKNETVFIPAWLNLVVTIIKTWLYLINEITPRSQFIFGNNK